VIYSARCEDDLGAGVKYPRAMLQNALTLDNVRAAFRAKGYAFFDLGDYNLNVFGVRRANTQSDRFDDFLGAIYKDAQRRWRIKIWPATTDPGRYWLERPQNPSGTAILVPGQYRQAYGVGKHQGKYTALCQVRPVQVWRDNNLDNIVDYGPRSGPVHTGVFGINIHRTNPYGESYLVGRWSAGCQVFRRAADFDALMRLVRISSRSFGERFTYTLFSESDFIRRDRSLTAWRDARIRAADAALTSALDRTRATGRAIDRAGLEDLAVMVNRTYPGEDDS